jgi:hypothetical protein
MGGGCCDRSMQCQCLICWKQCLWRDSVFLLLSNFGSLLAPSMLVKVFCTDPEILFKALAALLVRWNDGIIFVHDRRKLERENLEFCTLVLSLLHICLCRFDNVCWHNPSVFWCLAWILWRVCLCPNNVLCESDFPMNLHCWEWPWSMSFTLYHQSMCGEELSLEKLPD